MSSSNKLVDEILPLFINIRRFRDLYGRSKTSTFMDKREHITAENQHCSFQLHSCSNQLFMSKSEYQDKPPPTPLPSSSSTNPSPRWSVDNPKDEPQHEETFQHRACMPSCRAEIPS